jgi:hypothetical protein
MKQRILLLVVLAVMVAAVAYAGGTATVSGMATNVGNQALSGVKAQLRNVDTGALAGTTTSAANGSYSFSGLVAGNYVVEIVDANGRMMGTSALMSVADGAVISGVNVSASAAGALAQAAAAGGSGGSFWKSTGGILLLVGIGAGVTAGIVAANNNASPSR